MKALTYWGPRDVRYTQDHPAPVLQDARSVLVEVRLASICGTDLHLYLGHQAGSDADAPRGWCIGHEAVGVVREVGSDVSGFGVGDRVMIPASVGCGRCRPCREGIVTGCLTRSRDQGVGCYGTGPDLEGTQAELVAVPAADVNLWRMPDGLDDEAGLMLIDAAATAMYGLRRARVQPGESVTVVGMGPIGILAAMLARTLGAGVVFGVDMLADRLAHAEGLGIEALSADDAKQVIRARTGGEGTHAVVEAVGADATIALSLALARRGGRVSVIGIPANRAFPLDLRLAQVKELELAIGVCSVQRELPALVALTAAGRFDPTGVITHRLGLSEGPETYARIADKVPGMLKVTFDPAR
jgi:threonine dehydrogenase-like Zn-dependent dehydrogenase